MSILSGVAKAAERRRTKKGEEARRMQERESVCAPAVCNELRD